MARETKRSMKDGRATRGAYKRRLWLHAAEVLAKPESGPPLTMYPDDLGDPHQAADADHAKSWAAVVKAVKARGKKRE